MLGLTYHRIQNNLSLKELAEKVDITLTSMRRYENPDNTQVGGSDTYLRLSDALGVPIDALRRKDYPDIPDNTAIRKLRPSVTEVVTNPITIYRKHHNLTFRELAQRMGNSTTESGRQACAAKIPLDKHIEALAAYEDISVETFKQTYKKEEY